MKSERSAAPTSGDTPVVGAEPYESFYLRQWKPLLALAIATSGSRIVAEDLVQDALEAAFRDWERIRDVESPEAWVRRILLNKGASRYRRQIAELKALGRLAGSGEAQEPPDLSSDVESLWAEVRKLPRRQLQAVALRYVDEMTLEEIGSVLGCSKDTVNTHLRRAREKLARRLRLEEQS